MTKKPAILILLVLLFGFILIYQCNSNRDSSFAQQGHVTMRSYDISGKFNAPELEGGLGWLNIDKPVRIKDLRGKIVLLDFWTYCCINCMHIIPDLKKLEAKYPNELVVIGVHSAKFNNEKETQNIRSAILRYEIEHPVVNDANFLIWKQYGARGWPYQVLIDPDGKVVTAISGEGQYKTLDGMIAALIEKFETKLDRKPFTLALEKDKIPPSQLAYPGKILADKKEDRLFISDSNHNRILITDKRGNVLDIAGNGTIGLKDGSFEEAEFDHPQGMTLADDFLYVADTENHVLRRLDLQRKTVETVAGTGEQSYNRRGGIALQTGLNSPWDLTKIEGKPEIYIAMAGPHQLWVYHPDKKTVDFFAGTGREDIIDGPLSQCALAQPSGICTDGTHLYFADSEVSALRMVDMREGKVKTLIGTGLFDFGDRDGDFDSALLQHPLGVAHHEGKIYAADTYNHKIKIADPATRKIETFAGTGQPGLGSSTQPQFYEPGGLSVAGDKLYIADTNNNAIRIMDLNTKQAATLHLDFSEWNQRTKQTVFEPIGNPDEIALKDQAFPSQGTVSLALALPSNHHLNPLAKPLVQFRVTGAENEQWIGEPFHPEVNNNQIEFPISTGTLSKPQTLEAAVTFYYCREDNEGQCFVQSILLKGPIQSGKGFVKLQYAVQ